MNGEPITVPLRSVCMLLTSCHCCGLIQRPSPAESSWCARCHSRLPAGDALIHDNTPSAALALAAMAFYPLAILAPFVRIDRLGYSAESSLLTGTRTLLTDGHLFVGLVVLVFSIVFPAIKLLTLLVLSLSPRWLQVRHRATTYRAVEHLGRWGMLDVLLVAVLVAFVKLGDLVSFEIGPGLYLFMTFVALNLCAGIAFNSHALWEETNSPDRSTRDRSTPDQGEKAMEPSSQSADPNQPGAAQPETPAEAKQAGLTIPMARQSPPSRRGWWFVAVAAAIVAASTAYFVWPSQLHKVVVEFRDGHGLKAGNSVRYRGIEIGQVEELKFNAENGHIDVTLNLTEEASQLAREGTRWWIVRPEVSLSGTAGLETLLGDKFVTLQQGDGAPVDLFVGLDRPPLVDLQYEGGLSIVVQANAGPSLKPGAGVFHRGVRIGGVRDVGLATDASAIEYDVYIRPQFRRLLTDDAVFWNTGGLEVGVGLDGLRFRLESIAEIVAGGMAMAVPKPGKPVDEGTRFVLHAEPESDWKQWRPALSTSVRAFAESPELTPVVTRWSPSGWTSLLAGTQSKTFLASPKGDDLLVPASLVEAQSEEDFVIQSQGRRYEIRPADVRFTATQAYGPQASIRSLKVPEEIHVVSAGQSQSVSAAQWIREKDRYRLPSRFAFPDGSLAIGTDGAVLAYIDDNVLKPAEGAQFVRLKPSPEE